MPKDKQQRPKRKKIKNANFDKQKMKEVLQKLAESKAKNKVICQKTTSIQQMHVKHKKIHKNPKPNKNQFEENDAAQDQDDSKIQPQIQAKPVVNIFAVDSYQAEAPVVIHNGPPKESQMEDEENLQSKARRIMGENFNIEKFGVKPLRIIEENNEPIVMSQDEDQPNCIKTITHQNLKVPEGSKTINRKKQIEQLRQKLPIYMKEQEIVETVNTHLVTLICGETGSGKSTQLPQFLAEKNYEKLGKIAITQPRRLATISLARRVSEEMNYKIGQQIAYQVRHQRKQSPQSFIKFMTDGILLKQMSSDPLLLEYGVVIIDEAHERKLNTDILIGLLSRLILVRYKMSLENKCSPLRLVIMSATLRVTDFQNEKLFNFHIPILKVQAKMFPVTIFHERNTPDNYIDCAVKKCIKIHKQLPPGDVLIFLTGKQQIHETAIKLQLQLGRLQVEDRDGMQDESQQQQIKAEGEYIQEKPARKNSSSHINITDFIVYRLYSSLPTDQQDKIFKQPKPGCRKFIVSTNIAQTSITVPNIRYVIDSGQQKHRYFEDVWKWRKGWGSKAMAAQRAGRAGRTTHGYCYRLYSSALYANIMEEHPDPEICRLPLQSVVLEIKSIGYNNIFAFPFPTPPPVQSLKKSLQILLETGAVQGTIDTKYNKQPSQNEQQPEKISVQITDNCKVTQLGKIISFIPLSPKLAKMLLIANKLYLQKYILLIAVLLTVESIFRVGHKEVDLETGRKNTKSQLSQFVKKYSKYINKQCGSDLFVGMNIAGQFLSQIYHSHTTQKQSSHSHSHNHHHHHHHNSHQTIQSIISQKSQKLNLNTNTMRQFYYNCDQICQIYQTLTSTKVDLSQYQPPTPSQYQTILEVLLSVYHGNVCRIDQSSTTVTGANAGGYVDKNQNHVFLSRMSLLFKQRSLFMGCVDFYQGEIGDKKYMRYPFRVTNYQLLSTFGTVKQTTEYMWSGDRVVAKALGHIYGWEIPNLIVNDLKGQGKYYAFARMLLTGDVIPSFKILQQKKMLNYPINNIRPDNLQEKVQRLVMQFRKNDITTRADLIKQAQNNPHFLQKELKFWLNVKNYDGVYQTLKNAMLNFNTFE